MTCLNCLYFPMCKNIAAGEKTITSEVCEVFTSSTDMVEVVRCKDCKHFSKVGVSHGGTEWGQCHCVYVSRLSCESDDFCKHGEEKESEP